MKRNQLEHVLRAAGSITDETDFVVIGGQAMLGTTPNLPESLLVSTEVELYPRTKPEMSDLVDRTIGERSPFHETFGYYGHGVEPTTVTLAKGWEQRLVPFSSANTRGVIGWCLSPEDIAYSQLAKGREKDLECVSELLRAKLFTAEKVRSLSLSPELDQLVESHLQLAEKAL